MCVGAYVGCVYVFNQYQRRVEGIFFMDTDVYLNIKANQTGHAFNMFTHSNLNNFMIHWWLEGEIEPSFEVVISPMNTNGLDSVRAMVLNRFLSPFDRTDQNFN